MGDALMSALTLDNPEVEDTEPKDKPDDHAPATATGEAQPEPTKKLKNKNRVDDEKSKDILNLLVDTVERAPTPAVLSSVVGGISTLMLINADDEEGAPDKDEGMDNQGGEGTPDRQIDQGQGGDLDNQGTQEKKVSKQRKNKRKVQVSPEVKLQAAQ